MLASHRVGLESSHNATSSPIIRGKFNEHPVPGDYLDVVEPHLTREMANGQCIIRKFNSELGAGESFFNHPLDCLNLLSVLH